MVILLFILASRKVCLFIAADDIVVHPGIQESLFFFAVDGDIIVHPGIQESLFFSFAVEDGRASHRMSQRRSQKRVKTM